MLASNKFKAKKNLSSTSTLALSLVLIYIVQTFQFLFDPTINLSNSISLALYVAIPMSLFFVIPASFEHFNLREFSLFILLFSIPIHLVGVIQYFIDPVFFISTAYNESGGMVLRNFLGDTADGFKSFLRYPSIFASSDRYSGVSMVQVISSLFLVYNQPITKKSKLFSILQTKSLLCHTSRFVLQLGPQEPLLFVQLAYIFLLFQYELLQDLM